MSSMKKIIKTGENIGVATQVQGLTVEAVPHPKFKDMWSFHANGFNWIASDYAFEDGE